MKNQKTILTILLGLMGISIAQARPPVDLVKPMVVKAPSLSDKDVTFSDQEIVAHVLVVVDETYLYQKASNKSEKTPLSKNSEVRFIRSSVDEKWAQVKTQDNRTGWVRIQALNRKPR